ncbi:FkbO/Hyg5 family chorismatase [Saccharopolyspora sp. ASAGF58]|uniref:FkbO/Hyg5 family chorismatase n=1 Tax=Saccharopolyspora sp. ASAGF58 TaxID=2719023 RepID=UPI0014401988|nr:FkbO/Hyg5 family chorismatase [Saccharopolyspora sp. ASAGF58]QIZ36578.1 reactive intermediate/imine deaminase [Saccharopolyspora sp. ASAGF58]
MPLFRGRIDPRKRHGQPPFEILIGSSSGDTLSHRRLRDRVQGLRSNLATNITGVADAGCDNSLGRIIFADRPAEPALVDGVPCLTTHMANGSGVPVEEVWRTDRPVRSGALGEAVFSEDGEHLFYAVRLGPQPVYRERVRELYENALRFTWERGYTDLVRMWNLIGDITGPNAEGVEIYRDFCVGRAEAFATWAAQFPQLPAATGIGTLSPGIDLCFLATKQGRTVHLENPRQTPAYQYPCRYGPKSPSFARATFLRGQQTASLFVSGTASILGEDTAHVHDIARQTLETLRNIDVLVGCDNLGRHGVNGYGYAVRDLDQVKVYVRDPEHVAAVREICAQVLRSDSEIAYFNVDVCRPDLLVEIEGVCR